MTDKIYFKYDTLKEGCQQIAQQIKSDNYTIDRIVGVSRGGLFPAVELSHALDIPMTPVSYSSLKGNGDDKNHDNLLPDLDDSVILIVDDIADNGYTLQEIKEHYWKQGHNVATCTLIYKSHSIIKPDLFWRENSTDVWINFPWES